MAANQYPSADGASGSARGWSFPRHCEEPTGPALGGPDDKLHDEAIHIALRGAMDCFAALAMTAVPEGWVEPFAKPITFRK